MTEIPDRDHVQDVLRLRRRIIALEDQLGRRPRGGIRVPRSLQEELDRTARWASSIFIAYGFDTPDDFE